jgi:hypothetical protein
VARGDFYSTIGLVNDTGDVSGFGTPGGYNLHYNCMIMFGRNVFEVDKSKVKWTLESLENPPVSSLILYSINIYCSVNHITILISIMRPVFHFHQR